LTKIEIENVHLKITNGLLEQTVDDLTTTENALAATQLTAFQRSDPMLPLPSSRDHTSLFLGLLTS
jgi:hypothetical protein